MARLFLHIGTHKTGTTSFQTYLTDHRPALAAQGVSVHCEARRDGTSFAQAIRFSHAMLRPSLITGLRQRGHAEGRSLLRTARAIAQFRRSCCGAHRLMSSETLCFARESGEYLRLSLAFAGLSVTPILVRRNPAAWRASWENELTKPRKHPPLMALGEGLGDIRGNWVFDLDAIRAFWRRFGEIREIDYDAEMALRGSVLPALLNACDCPVPADTDAYFKNRRRTSAPRGSD